MKSLYKTRSVYGEETMELYTEKGRLVITLEDVTKNKVTLKTDLDLAHLLYDSLQQIFAEQIERLNLPSVVQGGLGRRYDWITAPSNKDKD